MMQVSIASFAIVTLLYTALAFMGAQGGECDSWANSMGGGASVRGIKALIFLTYLGLQHVTDLSGRETLVRITGSGSWERARRRPGRDLEFQIY
ncbi:hypothetical protein ZIOFF_005892 [Zingiber officinale]|uniref:Uncharacterized protein n=1 Tax=Zingiber officinale TaxID=94328 RepID=A0A8J5IDB2_ZINOF|nr:hypothetical protein ZIOFF_005892 [Zingiber officinale]